MDTHVLNWHGLSADDLLKIASLIGTIITWLIVNNRRPRLEAFFTHGAAHPIQGAANLVHTHSLVVRNSGSRPATGVRISHGFLPPETDIQFYPDMPRSAQNFGGNGLEILIERLRPKEQITLSYLYPGPTLLTQFGTQVKFDDGFAAFFEIQHVRVLPPWIRLIVFALMLLGMFLIIYIGLKVALFLLSLT